MDILIIAIICHEANKTLCESQGDLSQPIWGDAPDWQKRSAVDGVEFAINNPDSTPEDSHKNWLALKEKEGWVYGGVKDPEKKTHPCMVIYNELPTEQRAKDHLFQGIVRSLAPFVEGMELDVSETPEEPDGITHKPACYKAGGGRHCDCASQATETGEDQAPPDSTPELGDDDWHH